MVELMEEKCEVTEAIDLFDKIINQHSDLKIICDDEDGNLVVENSAVAEDVEGHQIIVPIDEIIKAYKADRMSQLLDVMTGRRKPIVCEGVTRIVGYYSRVHDWNKSKVGELRDRAQQNYALGGQAPVFDAERSRVINSL